jgi:hypothetical protein
MEALMAQKLNKHRDKLTASAVYVGRPSPFGNPFVIGEDGTRDEVIELYRKWFYQRIMNDPQFKADVDGLRGHDLVCWCAPKACHADVILEYLDQGGYPTSTANKSSAEE